MKIKSIMSDELDDDLVPDIAALTPSVRFREPQVVGDGGYFIGQGAYLGPDLVHKLARCLDQRQGVNAEVIGQGSKLLLGFASSEEDAQSEAGLHQDADGGDGHKNEQQDLAVFVHCAG